MNEVQTSKRMVVGSVLFFYARRNVFSVLCLIDSPESFIVKIDVPGFTKEDFDIKATEKTVKVYAEREKKEKEEEQG